jgi:hypothetical protein
MHSSFKSTLAVSAKHALTYWACQLVGWALVFGLNAAYVSNAKVDAGRYIAIFALASLIGMLLSHVWRALINQRGWVFGAAVSATPSSASLRALPWFKLIPGVMGVTVIHTALVASLFGLIPVQGAFKDLSWLPQALIFWFVIIMSWTVLYLFVRAQRGLRVLHEQALQLELLAKESQLRALQSQVNPHFFFNSLNSLRALIFIQPQDAAHMVDSLAGLMRYALTTGQQRTVTLSQELAMVKTYLAVEQIRFDERLRYQLQIADNFMDCILPPMSLQTLIENAVKHGVECRQEPSLIRVVASKQGNAVTLQVRNPGQLQRREAANPATSTLTGLRNTRERVQMLLGPRADCQLFDEHGEVVAQLTLPQVE